MTEKCENCTSALSWLWSLLSFSFWLSPLSLSSSSTSLSPPFPWTMEIKQEHDDRSACSWSSHRQPVFNVGISSPTSKSTARTSASSSTRSGRVATTRHCNKRRALSMFGFLISRSTRSYVSSNDFGNSSSVRRTLDGKQCRRVSSWQNTQRNLLDKFNKYCGRK